MCTWSDWSIDTFTTSRFSSAKATLSLKLNASVPLLDIQFFITWWKRSLSPSLRQSALKQLQNNICSFAGDLMGYLQDDTNRNTRRLCCSHCSTDQTRYTVQSNIGQLAKIRLLITSRNLAKTLQSQCVKTIHSFTPSKSVASSYPA